MTQRDGCDAIFDICSHGTPAELEAFLAVPEHAFAVYRCDETGDSPLHLVQCNEAHVLPMTRILIEHGASIRMVGREGATPLALAIWKKAPIDVIQLLVPQTSEHGGQIARIQTMGGCTPLYYLVRNVCDVGDVHEIYPDFLLIMELLLAHGGDCFTDTRYAKSGETLFMTLCQWCSANVVNIVMDDGAESGANLFTEINKPCSTGKTALMAACQNKAHGADIIRNMVARVPDLFSRPELILKKSGKSTGVFTLACKHGGTSVLRTLRELIPPATRGLRKVLAGKNIVAEFGDPVGAMQEAAYFGYRHPVPKVVKRTAIVPMEDWLVYRHFPLAGRHADEWTVAEYSQSLVYEQRELRSAAVLNGSACTVMHLYAYYEQWAPLRACMTAYQNPLLCDATGKRPVDYIDRQAFPQQHAELTQYARWAPTPVQRTWWRGPYFERRARTWCLVCERWKRTGVRDMGRDVRLLIVAAIAELETVHAWSAIEPLPV